MYNILLGLLLDQETADSLYMKYSNMVTLSTLILQWNLSKMVTMLGSHLFKTSSLPGPK